MKKSTSRPSPKDQPAAATSKQAPLPRAVAETLQNERNLFRTILDNLPSVIFCKDKDGRYVLSNRAHQCVLGATEKTILGKTAFDFHPAELARQYQKEENQVVRTGEPLPPREETALHHGKGEPRWHLTSRIPYKDENGRVVGVFGISHDITERKQMEAALRESGNFLDKIINSVAAPVLVKDRQHRWVLLNAAYCEFMGYKRDELLGKSDYDFFPKNEADEFWAKDEVVFATGTENINEEKFTDAKGKLHIIVTKKTLYTDEKGGKFIVGVINNITEHKAAEEVLRESQALYHSFVDQLPAAAFRKNRDGRYVIVNPRFCQLKGITAGEFLGRTAEEVAALQTPRQGTEGQAIKYAALGDEVHKQIMQTGKSVETEEEYTDADGGKQFFHVVRMPVFGPDQTLIGTQGILFDVTGHKQAEAASRQSHEEFKDLFDSAPIGFHEINAEGRLVRINKTELNMLGYTAEELLGQFVWKLSADEELSRRAALAKLAGEPPPPVFERVFRRKDGSVFPVSINDQVLKRADGAIIGIRAAIQDITEQRQAEKKLNERMEELLTWENVTLGREGRVMELKKEVNELLAALGKPPRYGDPEEEILAPSPKPENPP